MTVGFLLLLKSGLFLLLLMALAVFLSVRYVARFPALSRLDRVLKLIPILAALLPIAWPYVERGFAHARCKSIGISEGSSSFAVKTIRARFESEQNVKKPSYLLVFSLESPKWLIRQGITSFSVNGTTQELRVFPATGGCDTGAGWREAILGIHVCTRDRPDLAEGVDLEIIFRTSADADKVGSTTVVEFINVRTGELVSRFHSFHWFPSYGFFLLGSDLPYTCGDGHRFAKLLEKLFAH
jgi:hypothetical protein